MRLVNIDKRRRLVLTRDSCLAVPRGLSFSLRKKVVRRLDWHLSGYTAEKKTPLEDCEA